MTEINNEDLEKVSGGQSQYKNKYRSATFECTDSNCKGVVEGGQLFELPVDNFYDVKFPKCGKNMKCVKDEIVTF